MLRKFNEFFAYLSAHVSLVVLVVGSSAFAVAWAWAASATESIAAYGPIAWVAAGSFGAALFVLLALGIAKARERYVRATIQRRFFREPTRINPLEEHFTRRRIRLADMASPIDQVIKGKTFRNCEIIGPANLVFNVTAPGRGALVDNTFSSACAMAVREGAPAINSIILEDCSFYQCQIHQVTFLVPQGAVDFFSNAMPGLGWLTPPPAPPA